MTPSPATTTPVRLCRIAPWNRNLCRGPGTRYAQLGGRYFLATRAGGLWSVSEITAEGRWIKWVTVCAGNLPAVAQAIRDTLAGLPDDEITGRCLNAPRVGIGRNHPKHVERRESWRNPSTEESVERAARTTPLTDPQAEMVETIAGNGGRYTVPQSLMPRAGAKRKTADALTEKRIIRLVEKLEDGSDLVELTALGRLVYKLHPKIIRN